MTGQFDMTQAPLCVRTATLRPRDLSRLRDFYHDILGLEIISDTADGTVLGVQGKPMLILERTAATAPGDPQQAGLFHVAFLLPTRADLGRWLAHATQAGVQLHGASDHIVSEALYLNDPEGNGIEVYADRPVAEWQSASGEIRMATEPLDLRGLLRSAQGTAWQGFPVGGCIGHVHLQVGDTEVADRFYRDILGFDVAARYPGASFYGSGGYHHQLAGNIWNSRGAGTRPAGIAGLAQVELAARSRATRDAILARAKEHGIKAMSGDTPTLYDPWGTRIALAV